MDKKLIEDVLLKIGSHPSNKGFGYIVDAVYVICTRNYNSMKTMALYDDIAKIYGASRESVERAIRHELGEIRRRNYDFNMIEHYIGGDNNNRNSIMQMALRLKQDLESPTEHHKQIQSESYEIIVEYNGRKYDTIFGKYGNGWYIAIPENNLCITAACPNDYLYNGDKLSDAMNGSHEGYVIASKISELWGGML